MNKQITILLADDHEIFRNGVEQLINNEPDLHVVATADNGAEAVEKALAIRPDIILMDIAMPVMNGLDASAQLIDREAQSRILLFSLYDDEDYIIRSLRIGVMGYILKDAPNKVFLKAIRAIASGEYFYSGDLTNVLITQMQQHAAAERQRRLTEREVDVLRQIAAGIGNKQLAQEYGVSTRTIEAHRLNIMRKLQVKQIEAAIESAQKQGLI